MPSSREACSVSAPRCGSKGFFYPKLQVGPVSLKEYGGHLVLSIRNPLKSILNSSSCMFQG